MSNLTKSSDSIESLATFDMPKLRTRIIIIFMVSVAAYLFWFNVVVNTEFGGPDSWGSFGDYLGGILNPVLSALALVILAASLRANVVALSQNEEVLKLTKDELVLTRKQIEDTEKALEEQTRIVRCNAHTERLSQMAEKVYAEIMLLSKHSDQNLASLVFSQSENGRTDWNSDYISKALSVKTVLHLRVRRREEWTDAQWEFQRLVSPIADYLDCFVELSQLCRAALEVSKTRELSEFYTNRLWEHSHAIVSLGYKNQEQLELLMLQVPKKHVTEAPTENQEAGL